MKAASLGPTAVWQPSMLTLFAMLLILLGFYRETALAMVGIWARSGTFAHAFLVLPISVWLIWEKRHVLAARRPRPALWLALPLAGLGFVWLLGEMAAVNAVTQLAFVCMVILLVPLVIGLQAAQLIAFPLAFLLFAVPIGEFVMPQLMDWTAAFTVIALRVSGIPVYQEGLHFVIPSGRWSVIEACSGVRYLLASLTVGTLFAYLNFRSLKRRLIFVGVAILVPVVANWVRAYLIVLLGHLSGNELATGVDHLIYGWVFFGIVIIIMFALGMRWREDGLVADEPPFAAAGQAAGPGQLVMLALVFVAVAGAPHAALWALDSAEPLRAPKLDQQALAGGGWALSADPLLADWKPDFSNPSSELNTTLSDGNRRVGVYIAYYRQQNYERKLISSANVLVTSQDSKWALVARENRVVTLDGQQLTVRGARLRSIAEDLSRQDVQRLVAWKWYWINGRVTASDFVGKGLLAFSRLTGQGDDSAAVVIYALDGQPEGGEAALAAFLASRGSGIGALLADARVQH